MCIRDKCIANSGPENLVVPKVAIILNTCKYGVARAVNRKEAVEDSAKSGISSESEVNKYRWRDKHSYDRPRCAARVGQRSCRRRVIEARRRRTFRGNDPRQGRLTLMAGSIHFVCSFLHADQACGEGIVHDLRVGLSASGTIMKQRCAKEVGHVLVARVQIGKIFSVGAF